MRVLIVVSNAPCGGEVGEPALQGHLEADKTVLWDAFRTVFGDDAVKLLWSPDQEELRRSLTQMAAGAGMIFVYSGHGTDVADAADVNHIESALCLSAGPGGRQEPTKVRALLGWLEPHPPAYLSMFLGACRSAYVDVSRLNYDASVLTVSPEDIAASLTLSSETSQAGSGVQVPTPTAAALADALRQGPALDDSCDGWISDRELFGAVADGLLGKVFAMRRGLVLPRVRRQAPEPIQLWRLPQLSEECSARAELIRKLAGPELSNERARRASGRSSSGSARAYFYLESEQAHAACARDERDGQGNFPSPATAEVCRVLRRGGWRPVDLAPGAQALCLTDGCDGPLAHALARSVDFAELYFVHREGRWTHFDRLRDGRRVATFRRHVTVPDLPGRDTVDATWPSGDSICRFLGKVSADAPVVEDGLVCVTGSAKRSVAVCAEREGQCFFCAAQDQLPASAEKGTASND